MEPSRLSGERSRFADGRGYAKRALAAVERVYQNGQPILKKPQRLEGGVHFDHLMSEVFQLIDSTAGDQKIVVHKEYPRSA
jgi:hypothetical protein